VSTEVLLLILLFLGLLGLPMLPGCLELWRRRDSRPIEIDQEATVNPREPGLAFRRGLASLVEVADTDLPVRAPIDRAGGQTYEVHRELRLGPGARIPALLIALGAAEVGDAATLGDLYVRGEARLGAAIRLRALAVDGDVVLGQDSRVENWIDTEASARIGPRCDLGRSATAVKGLTLGAGCTFRRLGGLPVSTEGPARPPAGATLVEPGEPAERRIDDALLWAGRRLTVPSGLTVDRDLIVHGEVRVGAGNVVRGSIKAYGGLHLDEGVRVEGNLICRRDIRIAGDATIRGNVYAEGDVAVGRGTRVGDATAFKTVYAAGRIELAPDVLVFGWIVADHAGMVVGP
jgi:cytoskeletal protein CcmA (bactofilin family)